MPAPGGNFKGAVSSSRGYAQPGGNVSIGGGANAAAGAAAAAAASRASQQSAAANAAANALSGGKPGGLGGSGNFSYKGTGVSAAASQAAAARTAAQRNAGLKNTTSLTGGALARMAPGGMAAGQLSLAAPQISGSVRQGITPRGLVTAFGNRIRSQAPSVNVEDQRGLGAMMNALNSLSLFNPSYDDATSPFDLMSVTKVGTGLRGPLTMEGRPRAPIVAPPRAPIQSGSFDPNYMSAPSGVYGPRKTASELMGEQVMNAAIRNFFSAQPNSQVFDSLSKDQSFLQGGPAEVNAALARMQAPAVNMRQAVEQGGIIGALNQIFAGTPETAQRQRGRVTQPARVANETVVNKNQQASTAVQTGNKTPFKDMTSRVGAYEPVGSYNPLASVMTPEETARAQRFGRLFERNPLQTAQPMSGPPARTRVANLPRDAVAALESLGITRNAFDENYDAAAGLENRMAGYRSRLPVDTQARLNEMQGRPKPVAVSGQVEAASVPAVVAALQALESQRPQMALRGSAEAMGGAPGMSIYDDKPAGIGGVAASGIAPAQRAQAAVRSLPQVAYDPANSPISQARMRQIQDAQNKEEGRRFASLPRQNLKPAYSGAKPVQTEVAERPFTGGPRTRADLTAKPQMAASEETQAQPKKQVAEPRQDATDVLDALIDKVKNSKAGKKTKEAVELIETALSYMKNGPVQGPPKAPFNKKGYNEGQNAGDAVAALQQLLKALGHEGKSTEKEPKEKAA